MQSGHFIEQEGGDTARKNVFYGQEKSPDLICIAKMHLAVHGLVGKITDAIIYYQDEHTLVGKCDFVMANPSFNVDLVDAERIKGDRFRQAKRGAVQQDCCAGARRQLGSIDACTLVGSSPASRSRCARRRGVQRMSRSATPFCHGLWKPVRLGWMLKALMVATTSLLKQVAFLGNSV